MAYKIIKYVGKHKIKDTKTGKSTSINIEKYMNGGTEKDKKKKKDLSENQVQDIRDTTGVEFTQEGANSPYEGMNAAKPFEIYDRVYYETDKDGSYKVKSDKSTKLNNKNKK